MVQFRYALMVQKEECEQQDCKCKHRVSVYIGSWGLHGFRGQHMLSVPGSSNRQQHCKQQTMAAADPFALAEDGSALNPQAFQEALKADPEKMKAVSGGGASGGGDGGSSKLALPRMPRNFAQPAGPLEQICWQTAYALLLAYRLKKTQKWLGRWAALYRHPHTRANAWNCHCHCAWDATNIVVPGGDSRFPYCNILFLATGTPAFS